MREIAMFVMAACVCSYCSPTRQVLFPVSRKGKSGIEPGRPRTAANNNSCCTPDNIYMRFDAQEKNVTHALSG